MADRARSSEVAKHLNDLGALGLVNLSSNDNLTEVIEDYFVKRPLESSDSEEISDLEEEEEESQRTKVGPRPQSIVEPSEFSEDVSVSVPMPGEVAHESSEPAEDYDSDVDDFLPIRFVADEVFPEVEEESGLSRPEDIPACSCKLNDGEPCHTRFDREDLINMRLQCLEMTRQELDISVLSKLSCSMFLSPMTRRSKQKATERKFQKTDYRHHGHRICRDIFKYLHGIGQDKLNSLITHYKAAGVEARVHKSTRKRPHNALQYSETRMVVDFIVNYADVHAIYLPGRTPYQWKDNVRLLPTNCTKKVVYDHYKIAASSAQVRVVAYRTFRRIWQEALPFIVTMRPATDLCWVCQQGAVRLARTVNLSDESKSESLQAIQDHLLIVSKERSLYRTVCKEVQDLLGPDASLGQNGACTFDGKCHYSFDFAQQVQYPANPLQPGPIFFKSPRKCGLFGVCCEALSSQLNYLIDEAVDVGKGANCVVSLLHHFFEHFGLGEKEVHLHADNCSGQNKNSCMMMYLMWRVLTGRHEKITLSFMITGHTKFSCDWCFGLVKRLYRKTPVNCLSDLVSVVTNSSKGNRAQLCGDEKGNVSVVSYDWTTFLRTFFRKVKQIKKYHHFIFKKGSGILEVKEFSDSSSEEQNLLVTEPSLHAMPEPIAPTGLDLKRQWYLFEEIREFVTADDVIKDLVAPEPSLPKPRKVPTVQRDGGSSDEDITPAPAKRGRQGAGRARGSSRGKGKGRGKKSA